MQYLGNLGMVLQPRAMGQHRLCHMEQSADCQCNKYHATMLRWGLPEIFHVGICDWG